MLRRFHVIRRLRRRIFCILSPAFLFFRFSHAVRQYKYSRLFKIFRKDIFSASQCRFGSGRFDEINISTMTCYMRLQCIDGSQLDHGWGHFDLFKSLSGFCDLIFQRFCFLLPFLTEGKSVFFEIQYTSNDFDPGLFICCRLYLCKEPETVERRGRERTTFWIHDRKYRKSGLSLLGETVTLKSVAACLANIQNGRKQVVAQQIRIINVEQSVIGFIDKTRQELFVSAPNGLFGIDSPEEPVFCDADRYLYPRGVQKLSGASDECGFPCSLFARQEKSSGMRVYQGEEDRFLRIFCTTDGSERKSVTLHCR